MIVFPDCYRCKYFNKEQDNCKIYDTIPKKILDGKQECKEKKVN